MKRLILAVALLIVVSIPTPAGIIHTPGYCGEEVCPPPPCTEDCDDLNQSTDLYTEFVTSLVLSAVGLI